MTFSRTAPTRTPGLFQVVVEYTEEAVGRLALELAESLCRAALADAPFDLAAALARLRELDEDVRLGPSTGAIVQAATARGIPYRRLTSGSLVQFGWGSRQRRIQAAETDRTSAIAESIAQDKELTKKLLDAAGVPVPDRPPGRRMRRTPGAPPARSAARWWSSRATATRAKASPSTSRPAKHVMAAYAVAAEFRDEVIVERYLPGNDFRLLVVGNASGRGGAARSAPGDRRRRAHRPRAGRPGQPRPAPRRGSRHLAHQDPLRRHRPGAPRHAGLHGGLGAAQGSARHPAQQRQPEHRRHRHRRDRRRAPGGGRRARSPRRRWSGSTSAASTWCATTCASRSRNKAAASSRSTPRPACACTSSPRSARGGRSARRSSRTCSPKARTAASRWSRSPAPTARPPPCA